MTSSRRTAAKLQAKAARDAAGSGQFIAGAIASLSDDLTTINTSVGTVNTSVGGVTTALGAPDQDGVDYAAGNVTSRTIVQQFGHNESVGTTFVPISHGGIYRTVQVASATTLRIKAGGNANDTAAGTGAREVTLQGLDETGALVQEAVATAGASASAVTTTTFIRMFNAWVSASGSYGTQSTSSHAGDIVVENGAGGTDWGTISYATHSFGDGQGQIGAYTVPLGYTAYIPYIQVSVDSTKTTDMHFFQRPSILDAAAPYEAWRSFVSMEAIDRGLELFPTTAYGPFAALTDLMPMAKVSSTTSAVAINFEIVLVAT